MLGGVAGAEEPEPDEPVLPAAAPGKFSQYGPIYMSLREIEILTSSDGILQSGLIADCGRVSGCVAPRIALGWHGDGRSEESC